MSEFVIFHFVNSRRIFAEANFCILIFHSLAAIVNHFEDQVFVAIAETCYEILENHKYLVLTAQQIEDHWI